jgi:hypothetical protein
MSIPDEAGSAVPATAIPAAQLAGPDPGPQGPLSAAEGPGNGEAPPASSGAPAAPSGDAPFGPPPDVLELEQVLAAPDLDVRYVHVAEWGGSFGFRPLTLEQVRDLNRDAEGPDGQPDPVRLMVLAIIAASYAPRLELEHADALLKRQAGAVQRIGEAIMRASGMDPRQVVEPGGSITNREASRMAERFRGQPRGGV